MSRVPGHSPAYRTLPRRLLPAPLPLRACALGGGTWGRFGELFAYREEKEVLTSE